MTNVFYYYMIIHIVACFVMKDTTTYIYGREEYKNHIELRFENFSFFFFVARYRSTNNMYLEKKIFFCG